MKTPAGGRVRWALHIVFKHLLQESAELPDVGKVVRVGLFQLLDGCHLNQYDLPILSASVFFFCPDIGSVGFLVFAGGVLAYGSYFFGGIENEQGVAVFLLLL